MRKVAAGMDEQVAVWVCARVPDMDLSETPYTAIGQLDGAGNIVGGAVFTNYTKRDVHISCAGLPNRWLTRRFLGEVYRYVFFALGCRRTTVMIRRGNEKSVKLVLALGYHYEGVLRAYLPNDADCLLYGMLREECRWLNQGLLNNAPAVRPRHDSTAALRHNAGRTRARLIPLAGR